jgi:hypothetical protein
MTKTYNHMFTVAFTVAKSPDETGEQVPPDSLRAGLLKRIADLDANNEWEEACGKACDTYEDTTE